MLNRIAKAQSFTNYNAGKLGAEHLCRMERTERMLNEIMRQQRSDILIVPAQFGRRHRCRSVRSARDTMVTDNEIGFGAFEVACMLLVHPNRLVSYHDLRVDCPGEEYHPNVSSRIACAPVFWFDAGLKFSRRAVGEAIDGYGSVSGFLLNV